MKKAKLLNILSLVFNLIILGLVIFILATNTGYPHLFLYFTVASNVLVGFASLLVIVADLIVLGKGNRIPSVIYVIKLVASVTVSITMLTVLLFLAPTGGWNYMELLGFTPFSPIYLFFHLVIPVLSIVSVLFFDLSKKSKWPVNFITLLPLLAYGAVYGANYYLHFGLAYGSTDYDWYGFFKLSTGGAGIAIGVALLAGLLVIGFFISLLYWKINQAHTEKYFRSVNESINNAVEEEKEEEVEDASEQEEKELPTIEEEPEEEKREQVFIYHPVEESSNEKEAAEEVKEEEEKPEEKEDSSTEEEKPTENEGDKEEVEEDNKVEDSKEEKKVAKKKPTEKKEEPKHENKDQTKVYHLTKRKEDGMWAITFVGGKKAVKLFKTKKEAEEYLKTLTENQGATALIRNSKGSKAGKFASSIKTDEKKK